MVRYYLVALSAVLLLSAAAPASAASKAARAKPKAARAKPKAAPAKPKAARAKTSSIEARTRALIAAFQAVQTAPKGKKLTAAQRAKNAVVFGQLDGFFDQQALKTAPIARHQAKFTAAQRGAFGDTFYALIRLVAFPDSGAFFVQAKWQLQAGKKPGDMKLHAEIEADDVDTDMVFHWHKVGGVLRVYDVSFDGASLMKDYGNQFGRIIAKSGASGLIAKLNKRLQGERRARKGLLP